MFCRRDVATTVKKYEQKISMAKNFVFVFKNVLKNIFHIQIFRIFCKFLDVEKTVLIKVHESKMEICDVLVFGVYNFPVFLVDV